MRGNILTIAFSSNSFETRACNHSLLTYLLFHYLLANEFNYTDLLFEKTSCMRKCVEIASQFVAIQGICMSFASEFCFVVTTL